MGKTTFTTNRSIGKITQSCKKFAENDQTSNRIKHIDVRHLFIRDSVKKKIIKCIFCPTEEMSADILTKPLDKTKFEKFTKSLGLHE